MPLYTHLSENEAKEIRVSIGIGMGPPIGIQRGPL
jgi:hypothetical protein